LPAQPDKKQPKMAQPHKNKKDFISQTSFKLCLNLFYKLQITI